LQTFCVRKEFDEAVLSWETSSMFTALLDHAMAISKGEMNRKKERKKEDQ
jgi:hypothetical protein